MPRRPSPQTPGLAVLVLAADRIPELRHHVRGAFTWNCAFFEGLVRQVLTDPSHSCEPIDDHTLAIRVADIAEERALELAERLRLAVASLEPHIAALGSIAISTSVGLACAPRGTEPHALLAAARKGLALAQESGGNCVAYRERIDLRRDLRRIVQQRSLELRPSGVPAAGLRMPAVVHALATHRCVTFRGGTQRDRMHAALDLARHVGGRYPDGIFLVRLGEPRNAARPALAIAERLGVHQPTDALSLAAIAALLHGQRVLVLLNDPPADSADVREALMTLLDASAEIGVIVNAARPLDTPDEHAQWIGAAEDEPTVPAQVYATLPLPTVETLVQLAAFAGGAHEADLLAASQLADRTTATIVASLLSTPLIDRDPDGRLFVYRAARELIAGDERLKRATERCARRHAEHFCSLAAGGRSTWNTTPESGWIPRFEPELQNFRAALDWGLRQADPTAGAQLAVDLLPLWSELALPHEAAGYLGAFLARAAGLPDRLAIETHVAMVGALRRCARPAAAREHAQIAVERARRFADPQLLGRALGAVGTAIVDARGDRSRAYAALCEALDLFEDAHDLEGMAEIEIGLGIYHHAGGSFEQALAHYRQSLQLFRGLGNEYGINVALGNIGALHYMHGEFDEAAWVMHEHAVRCERRPSMRNLDYAYANLAEVELARGLVSAARVLVRRALALYPVMPNDWTLVNAMTALARCALALGSAHLASQFAGFADARLTAINHPRQPTQERTYRALMSALQQALPETVSESYYEHGQTMTVEAALALAASI